MRRWISGSAFLMLGLLIGCGGENSSPPQAGPESKTEQIIGKDGEVLWQTTIVGLDGEKDVRAGKRPAAKR